MARGFVRKRGDTWYAYWRDQRGKQRSKAVSPRKKDAEAYLVEVQKEVNENTYRDIKKIAFSTFAKLWLSDYAAIHVKPSTLSVYTYIINSSFSAAFEDMNLSSIDNAIIQRYISERTREGRASATVKKELTLLKTMLGTAVEWGYLKTNPAAKAKPPKDTRQEMDFLTPNEVKLFLSQLDDEWRPFFMTAVFTGMRLGEIIGLKWSDIDWNSSTIHVQRSVWNGTFLDTKSKNSNRVIGMTPKLAEELIRHRTKQCHIDCKLVFCNDEGNVLDAHNIRKRVFYPALEKAGLRRIRIHDLRHTFASLLINQGENLKYVQHQLGHASITTTVDRYGHLMPDIRMTACEKLDEAIFDAA